MRILICGDRNWADGSAILMPLLELDKTRDPNDAVTIIHGGCAGADTLAGRCAEVMQYAVEEYPADWKRYHRAAGPIRNAQMLKQGKPDEVWAFHADLEHSKGTKNMVDQARKAGVPVKVFER